MPWDQYPYLEAIPTFGRAMGALHTGDFAKAQAAIDRLETLEEKAASLNIAYDWGIQVRIQKTAAKAWLLYEQGEKDRALDSMKSAADMERSTEKNPVRLGEVLPAVELYGDMLLASERYAEARKQYESALGRSPNRFRSLYGAGRAAELHGDKTTASRYYRELLANCPEPSGPGRPELEHAREFLAG